LSSLSFHDCAKILAVQRKTHDVGIAKRRCRAMGCTANPAARACDLSPS